MVSFAHNWRHCSPAAARPAAFSSRAALQAVDRIETVVSRWRDAVPRRDVVNGLRALSAPDAGLFQQTLSIQKAP